MSYNNLLKSVLLGLALGCLGAVLMVVYYKQ